MKLLLDQGAPRSAAALLRSAGFDAVHTGEIGLARADDAQIIQHSLLENRVVITLDADFHALLALSKAVKPSVIRIRVENLQSPEFANLVQKVLSQCAEELKQGAMISVRDYQIRVHRLPVA